MIKSEAEFYLKQQFKIDNRSCNNFGMNENIQVSNQEVFDQKLLSDLTSIFLVTEGYGKVYLKNEEVEFKRNTLIQIPQSTIVMLKEQNTEIYLSGIRFSTQFVSESRVPKKVLRIFDYFSSTFLSVVNLKEKEADDINRQIIELTDDINKCKTEIFGKELLIINFQKFLMKIGELRQQYTEVTNLNYSPQESLYIKFNDLVQRQFKEKRTVKKYAGQLNMTAKYLSEVVKAYSGKYASEIIQNLVISEAKFLLNNHLELNISQVADILHFSDTSTFGKYFKNKTGLSPKQYRAKH